MMLIEDLKKDRNNSLKYRRTWVNRKKPLMRKQKSPLRSYRKTQSTEQNHPASKNGS